MHLFSQFYLPLAVLDDSLCLCGNCSFTNITKMASDGERLKKWNVYHFSVLISFFRGMWICLGRKMREEKIFIKKNFSRIWLELDAAVRWRNSQFGIDQSNTTSVEQLNSVFAFHIVSNHIISYHGSFVCMVLSAITTRHTMKEKKKSVWVWIKRDDKRKSTLNRWYAIHVQVPGKRIKIECQTYKNRHNLHEVQEREHEWDRQTDRERERCDAMRK